jgi:iron-sulfur cluster repair protein YtfE (RIC family)
MEEAMTDLIHLLEHDHRRVEDLFAAYNSNHSRAVAERIFDELSVHAQVEEEVAYPFIAEVADPEGAFHGKEEHDELRELIGEARNAPDAEILKSLMADLEEEVKHHVSEEEGEVFPKTRDASDQEVLDEMGRRYAERKSEVKHGSPMSIANRPVLAQHTS